MPNQISVPFHGSSLFIVDHNNEPYTPMKPIVEGMGLDWRTQSRKLRSNGNRWSVVMMTTVASDNKERESTCIPLRKLFGWLQTLQPNRVRPEIRDKVIQYQNECDDVLWKHWSKQNEPALPNTTVMPPNRLRLLLNMHNGHVVSSLVVPDDAVVFGLSEIPELLKEPGYFSIEDLAQVAKVANERLAELVRYRP